MIHKACIPVYMNSGKIVADGRDGTGGKFEGSTRGPRGPKKLPKLGEGGGGVIVMSCSKGVFFPGIHSPSW